VHIKKKIFEVPVIWLNHQQKHSTLVISNNSLIIERGGDAFSKFHVI